MATDIERLVLSMEANIKKYERELSRATDLAVKNMGQIERRVELTEKNIEKGMSRVAGNIRNGFAGILAGISLGEAGKIVDGAIKISNALKVAGLEGQELEKVYQKLFTAAQEQGAPLEALATLYGRVALSQKALGISTEELTNFASGVAVALRVAGQSSEEASGALMQLGQLLGAGTVRAEEFNSVQEGALPILQAVAAGIKEAGGDVSKLRQIMLDGKLSSEAFFRGFEAGTPLLEELAGRASSTLAQQMQRLQNAMYHAAREMYNIAEASDAVKNAVKSMMDLLNQLPEIFRQDLKDLAKIAEIADRITNTLFRTNLPTATISQSPGQGAEEPQNPLVFRVRPKAGNTSIGSGRGVDPISYEKYPVKGKDKKGGSGSDKTDEYQREIDALGRRTRALDAERAVVGESAYEVARSEAALRLEEAAKKANLTVTEEMQIKIDEMASAFGRAKVALDEAEKKQHDFQEASRVAGATLSDAFKDAILNGEKLTDVMDKLLKSLASRGIDSLFDTLFKKGGAGSDFLSSIFSAVTGKGYAEGGYTGPGGKYQPAGVVHRGEYVMDAQTVRRIGRSGLDAIRAGKGYAAGGMVGVPMAPQAPPAVRGASRTGVGGFTYAPSTTIDARGADMGVEARLKAMLDARDRALPALLRDINRRMG